MTRTLTPVVHIVDDDTSFRTSLARLLETAGFSSVGYASGTEILASARLEQPGCVLVDLQMPELDGLELQQRLAEKAPLLPIIFLTGQGSIDATVRAIKAGAEDFLEKSGASTALIQAIERALLRYEGRRAERDHQFRLNSLVASLTAREAHVFELMVRGKRNKEIAFQIGTSERTVKAHRHSIMEKLDVRSLAEAVSIAERIGLLSREGADRRAELP
jgi:FixJ family two-component response regulator